VPELPAPLPPAERTVGQLIAETIRAYGSDFWRGLLLGFPLALADQASIGQPPIVQMIVFLILLPLFVGGYLYACAIVLRARPTFVAAAVGALIWLPFPTLRAIYILPGLAWLALVGLAVPAAMVEKLRFRPALIRGRELGLADYVHALGSLAALVIVVGVAETTLGDLLHSQSDAGARVAVFLSDVVLSPLLFLGGALLYVDQAARVGLRSTRRRRPDADLHPPVDADAAGHSDPQVEP